MTITGSGPHTRAENAMQALFLSQLTDFN
jgi:hypothetical protein